MTVSSSIVSMYSTTPLATKSCQLQHETQFNYTSLHEPRSTKLLSTN